MKLRFAIFFSCLISISCSNAEIKVDSDVKSYSQGFKTDISWIVLEWNGQLRGYGSGFLVDKGKGAFYTNKHVSDLFNSFGKNSHRMFFNGKVYRVELVKTPPLADAALVRIIDKFNPADFPEPNPISYEKVKVKDTVSIGGFHPHSYWIRKSDEDEGYKFPVLSIYKEYYRAGKIDPNKEQEVVFEKVSGQVTRLDMSWSEVEKNMDKACTAGQDMKGNFIEEITDVANFFVEIKISKDHKFPFGGLSGSPVRNASGETIGILTRQDPCRLDYDREQLEKKGVAELKGQLWDTIYMTPIESTKELIKYLE